MMFFFSIAMFLPKPLPKSVHHPSDPDPHLRQELATLVGATSSTVRGVQITTGMACTNPQ